MTWNDSLDELKIIKVAFPTLRNWVMRLWTVALSSILDFPDILVLWWDTGMDVIICGIPQPIESNLEMSVF